MQQDATFSYERERVKICMAFSDTKGSVYTGYDQLAQLFPTRPIFITNIRRDTL